ncbi:MAG: hypothetical protein IIY43_04530 [Oscillospiraceae bacterium]|nr:hypothetical protein [Oscillospiraceae bacterium]MBQ1756426.1 hypothetical protein [Oscillospiraceae bacterium]
MTISAASWARYIAQLRAVNDAAYKAMRGYLDLYGLPAGEEAEDAMIDVAYAITKKYAEASATLSARMYDSLAELTGKKLPAAVPADAPTVHEVAKAVVGTSKTGNPEIVSSSVSRLVKQTGVDTTMQNALRDGAEWAWVPQGDTCAFCLTLASRGWQRASRDAIRNGHAEHIHANCDCTYAIRFDQETNVAGYDPDKYLKMYYDADGTTPEAKINAMRRDLYAQNREKILAQKADAYEKRKELESSSAEELK